jgi:hypothetical protein
VMGTTESLPPVSGWQDPASYRRWAECNPGHLSVFFRLVRRRWMLEAIHSGIAADW